MKLLATTLLACALTVSYAQNKPKSELPWDATDLGPFHSGCFKLKVGGKDQITAKGIAIKVGGADAKATVLFDTELLRWTAAWEGGFIEFPRGRGGLEGQIKPAGTIQFTTSYSPGWSDDAIGDDPRAKNQGNLPKEQVRWRGLYTHGEHVLLTYDVGKGKVIEVPGFDPATRIFTRSFTVKGAASGSSILIGELPRGKGSFEDASIAVVEAPAEGGNTQCMVASLINAPELSQFEVSEGGRMTLKLGKVGANATFTVAIWAGSKTDRPANAELLKGRTALAVDALLKGGPARWGEPLVTKGVISEKEDAYVIDDIPLPEPNPFNSWLRLGGHDFFPDGSCAVVSVSGDVWLVRGLDEKLEKVTWKRFATGLFQPLGCKVIDGKIYVLGRDQITRLHDLNGDGEADLYENFNNDCVATDNYHEFALDLQTDRAGNFYYAKGSPWTPTVSSPHQGCLLKVSKDGSKLEIFATGLRAPNGVGMGPNDELTCSDNQGHWMPANRLNLVKKGGFYGMVPAVGSPGTELEFAL